MSTPAGVGSAQGGINAVQGFLSVVVANYGDVALQLTGTFVGTVQFEGTVDNGNWVSLALTPSGGGSDVTSATAPGAWSGNCGGYYAVRARCSAFTSGVIYVSLSAAVSTVHAVAVVVQDALSGIGTIDDPVNVQVDGTTVGINGSNQLEVLTAVPAIDATFVTATDETGTLTGSRQLVDGTNTTVDVSTPGQIKVNASGGGSLPLQVAADGDPVVNNAEGGTVIKVGSDGGPQLITPDNGAGDAASILIQAGNAPDNVAGSVTIQYGNGDTNGALRLKNGASADRVVVDESGIVVTGSVNATVNVKAVLDVISGDTFGVHIEPDVFRLMSFNNAVDKQDLYLLSQGHGAIHLQAAAVDIAPGGGLNASLTTDLGVPNADLTWTSTGVGQQGNATQIAYVDPGLPSQSLSASYAAPVLTINLATDGGSAITTTASDIIALGPYDSAPVTAALADGSDGSGAVIALSATNLTGGLAALNVPSGDAYLVGTANVLVIPTADPHVVGALWNNMGLLTISAG